MPAQHLNVLLVGESGLGKTRWVYNVAAAHGIDVGGSAAPSPGERYPSPTRVPRCHPIHGGRSGLLDISRKHAWKDGAIEHEYQADLRACYSTPLQAFLTVTVLDKDWKPT